LGAPLPDASAPPTPAAGAPDPAVVVMAEYPHTDPSPTLPVLAQRPPPLAPIVTTEGVAVSGAAPTAQRLEWSPRHTGPPAGSSQGSGGPGGWGAVKGSDGAPRTVPPPVVAAPAFPAANAVVQREPEDVPVEPAPAPSPPPAPAAPAPVTPQAAQGQAAAAEAEPEELVRRLYDPLLRQLKAELRRDRERRGLLTDLNR